MAQGLPPSLSFMNLETAPQLMTALHREAASMEATRQTHSHSLQKEEFHVPAQERVRIRRTAQRRLLEVPTQTASRLPL